MSRNIIDYGNPFYRGLLVNTFWGGKERGECVQFTEGEGQTGFVEMSRDEAIQFLQSALESLKQQKEADKERPPWWQKVSD